MPIWAFRYNVTRLQNISQNSQLTKEFIFLALIIKQTQQHETDECSKMPNSAI